MTAVRGHLHNDLLTVFCLSGILLGDKDLPLDLIQIRFNKPKGTLLLIRSHELCQSVACDRHNLCLRAAASLVGQRQDLYLIFMKGTAGIFLRNKIILLFPLDFHETKALRMADKCAFDRLSLDLFFFLFRRAAVFHIAATVIHRNLIVL